VIARLLFRLKAITNFLNILKRIKKIVKYIIQIQRKKNNGDLINNLVNITM
jgi:hypothetical protein